MVMQVTYLDVLIIRSVSYSIQKAMIVTYWCKICSLLPWAVKDTNVIDIICALSEFFKELYLKELLIEKLHKIGANVVITLCKMEKIFPPSFFTIMVHLLVHLTEEAKLGGPFFVDECTQQKGQNAFSFN